MTSHHLIECWNITNWTLTNKFQWNFNQNSYIFIEENAFENIVCKMAAILSLGLNVLTFEVFQDLVMFQNVHWMHIWIFLMAEENFIKIRSNFVIGTRAGQDQGGPRWDTLTKKSKSTKLLHIVLCYTLGVVAYDPVLFGGCIPPPLTPLQVKPEALILISIGGRTLQCGVMYIFYVLVLPKLTFITYWGIGKSNGF